MYCLWNTVVSRTFDCRYSTTFNIYIVCTLHLFTLNIEFSVNPAVINIHKEKFGGIKL